MACALSFAAPASAQDKPVKIGILNDQASVYADHGGSGPMQQRGSRSKTLAARARQPDRDDLRRPPEQARSRGSIARRWYDTEGVDMITDMTTVLGRARGTELPKKEQARHRRGRRDIAPRKSCRPNGMHWANDTHALRGRHLRITGAGRRRQLVLPDRGIRLGPFAGTGRRRFRQSNGGKVARPRPHSPQHAGFLPFLLQAQSQGKNHRPRHAGLDTTNSIKQAAEFGIVKERPEAGRPLADARRGARSWYRGGTGAGAERRPFTGTATTRAAISATASSSVRAECRT